MGACIISILPPKPEQPDEISYSSGKHQNASEHILQNTSFRMGANLKLNKKIERIDRGVTSFIHLEMPYEDKQNVFRFFRTGPKLWDCLDRYETYRLACVDGKETFPGHLMAFARGEGQTVTFPNESIAMSFENDIVALLKKFVEELREISSKQEDARNVDGITRQEEL